MTSLKPLWAYTSKQKDNANPCNARDRDDGQDEGSHPDVTGYMLHSVAHAEMKRPDKQRT
jgi:hypothetical protein